MFRDRLNSLAAESGLSQTQIASRCGVSSPAVKKWLDGKTKNIDACYLVKLAEIFNVNVAWLATGEGIKRGSNVSELADEDDAQISSSYLKIPESKVVFAAGTGWEPTYEEIENGTNAIYKASWFRGMGVRPENCARFRVSGQSMYPLICDGDYILVDLSDNKEIRPNKIYAIGVEGAMRVKRLLRTIKGELQIKSENPDYPTEILSSEDAARFVVIIGRVIERSGSSAL